MVGVSNNPTTHNESEDIKMDNERLINVFYENIDSFNKKAVSFIENGDIDKAIDIYKRKIDYIIYSYEFDVINLVRAMSMKEATKNVIDILSCEEGYNETNK